MTPGAYNMARWMVKLIYCLKIYLFYSQFNLTLNEKNSLCYFNIFVLSEYEYWFTAQFATSAPRNDLNFIKDLIEYKLSIKKVVEVKIKSLSGHFWYFDETLISLAFFDYKVSHYRRKKN